MNGRGQLCQFAAVAMKKLWLISFLFLVGCANRGLDQKSGGGIQSYVALTVTNSTSSGNSAGVAGGIFSGGTLNVVNSTLSGNSASSDGGCFRLIIR
jgi:hypothetical protein